MSEPRTVSPEEAKVYMAEEGQSNGDIYDLARTVATEPKRIAAAERSAVVKAFRKFAETFDDAMADREADAIENGADL